MVQGINTQNYSVAQLKELKNAGVQGITDEDIKAAEKREAEVVEESDDNAEVSYTVEDDAAEVNEASKEVKAAEESGKSLCNILETLIEKCDVQEGVMEKVQKELSDYDLQVSDIIKQEITLEDKTSMELESVKDESEDISQDIEAKQKEIKQKEEEIKRLQAEISSNPESADVGEKQDKIESLKADIKTLKVEIDPLSSADSKKADEEKDLKDAAKNKLDSMGKTFENVKNVMTDALNKATNANEYADVTIEKGFEATETKTKDFFEKAGNSKTDAEKSRSIRNAIDSIFRRSKMNNLGNTAIATGEHLGNSSVNVGKEIKELGSQYNIAFSETSSIDALTTKEYVDTSKMDSMVDKSKAKGFLGKILAQINNQKTLNDVANEAKEMRKKSKETTSTEEV